MRTVYREKKYTCGEYLDVYIYPVFETGKLGGGKRAKKKPSTEAQKKLNQRHREEKLVRLLHANFTPEDLEIHLTYKGEQPGSDEEAARNLRNYIRRIQRLRKKMGLPPLKYIAVTERGKRGGRYHHHITVNGGIDRDTLESMWEYGYANSRRLQFTEDGLAGLGNYIVMVNHWRKGVLVSAWVPREGNEFKRNEPLDLRNYAQAAMEILGPDILKAPEPEKEIERQKRRATRRRGGFSGIA